jgi:gliding motility-associated-like protein
MKSIFTFFILVLSFQSFAQISTCFEIESILVDACAPTGQEGLNEMVRFHVGPNSLNASDLNVTWATTSNPWTGVCQTPETADIVSQLNATIVSCGILIEPVGGVLPANSKVLLISSSSMDVNSNSFAGLSDTLYILFHCSNNSTGNFANYNSAGGLRTLSMNFSSPVGCSDVVSYDRGQLVNQSGNIGSEDGATANFTPDGTASYTNVGCSAPFIPIDPSWTSPAFVCESDEPIDLNSLISGSSGGVWSGSGVTGSTFDPTGLEGPVLITYTINAGDCTAQSEQLIQVSAGGDATWTSPGQICSSSSPIDLNNFVTGTAGGTFLGNGIIGSVFNPAGLSGDIAIIYTLGSGTCSSSQTQIINVSDGPDLTWSFINDTYCSDANPIVLDELVSGTLGGVWAGDGVDLGIFDPEGLQGEIVITYSLSIGDCAGVFSDTINVVPPPSAAWELPNFICTTQGDFQLNSLITGNTGGIWSGENVSDSVFNAGTLSGSFPITYTVGDASCGDALTQILVVLPAPDAPVILGSPNYCEGEELPVFTSTGGSNTSWFDNSNLSNPITTSESFQPSSSSPSIYYATTFSGTCISEVASITLNLVDSVYLTLSASSDLTICQGEAITLIANSSGNISWSNGFSGSEVVVSQADTYTATSTGFCNVASESITVLDGGIQSNLTVSTNQGLAALEVQVTGTSTGSDFCAYFLNGIETQIPADGMLTIPEEGLYTLIYHCENAAGCVAEQSTTIEVLSGIVKFDFPNSFTPNGDGFNDFFKAQTSGIKELKASIFNRWGEKVSEWEGVSGNWNGDGLIGQSPDGVYFYIARATDLFGVELEKHGSITLIR